MCIIYNSVDDFVNNVLFLVSSSFFGDIYKYVNEFINTKKYVLQFINVIFFELPENFFFVLVWRFWVFEFEVSNKFDCLSLKFKFENHI